MGARKGSQVGFLSFFLFAKFSKGLETLMFGDTKGVVTIHN